MPARYQPPHPQPKGAQDAKKEQEQRDGLCLRAGDKRNDTGRFGWTSPKGALASQPAGQKCSRPLWAWRAASRAGLRLRALDASKGRGLAWMLAQRGAHQAGSPPLAEAPMPHTKTPFGFHRSLRIGQPPKGSCRNIFATRPPAACPHSQRCRDEWAHQCTGFQKVL